MSAPDKLEPDAPPSSDRRNFLIQSGKGLGAVLSASVFHFPVHIPLAVGARLPVDETAFQIHPCYRTARPLDALLLKAQPGTDEFVTEKYADDIEKILRRWEEALLADPHDSQRIASYLASDFLGAALRPAHSTNLRSDNLIHVDRHAFDTDMRLKSAEFADQLRQLVVPYNKVHTAEFQVINITADQSSNDVRDLVPQVRYEMVAGSGFYREQRVGHWDMHWQSAPGSEGVPVYTIRSWRGLNEQQSRSFHQSFVDVGSGVLGGNAGSPRNWVTAQTTGAPRSTQRPGSTSTATTEFPSGTLMATVTTICTSAKHRGCQTGFTAIGGMAPSKTLRIPLGWACWRTLPVH